MYIKKKKSTVAIFPSFIFVTLWALGLLLGYGILDQAQPAFPLPSRGHAISDCEAQFCGVLNDVSQLCPLIYCSCMTLQCFPVHCAYFYWPYWTCPALQLSVSTQILYHIGSTRAQTSLSSIFQTWHSAWQIVVMEKILVHEINKCTSSRVMV